MGSFKLKKKVRHLSLVKDDVLGLTLHPFDLATNKVLAIGRPIRST